MSADKKTNINDVNVNEPRIAHAKKTWRHPDFKSLYLNHLQVGFTRWDFQMVLGLVEVSKVDEFEDVLQETACVKMTPAYAKALVTDLAATLKRYEEMYGEIQTPLPLDQPLTKK